MEVSPLNGYLSGWPCSCRSADLPVCPVQHRIQPLFTPMAIRHTYLLAMWRQHTFLIIAAALDEQAEVESINYSISGKYFLS